MIPLIAVLRHSLQAMIVLWVADLFKSIFDSRLLPGFKSVASAVHLVHPAPRGSTTAHAPRLRLPLASNNHPSWATHPPKAPTPLTSLLTRTFV